MGRKLKVFEAQFGFWDCVVAAPSQAAALRAWGTRQNLFADGEARETTDTQTVALACAQPGTPLRRAVGSDDPFSLEPRLPQLPASRGTSKPRQPAKPTRTERPMPPPPDRGALDAAQASLREVEDDRRRAEGDFARRRAALTLEEDAARMAYAAARSRATDEVERCRKAFLKAGGRLQS